MQVRQLISEPMFASESMALPVIKNLNLSLVRQHIITHDQLENSMSSYPHNQITAHGGPGPRYSDTSMSLNNSYSSYGHMPSSYSVSSSKAYVAEESDSWILGLNSGMRNLNSPN